MEESEDESVGRGSFVSDTHMVRRTISSKSRTSIKPERSHEKGNQIQQAYDDRNSNSFKYRKGYEYSSSSKGQHPELRKSSKKATIHGSLERKEEESEEIPKVLLKGVSTNEDNLFPTSEIVISDCWRTASGENIVKFVELFKENSQEEVDVDVPTKKRKFEEEEYEKSPPYTKEFHMLTEVQRARILAIVEDTIKKIANNDYFHSYCGGQSERQPEELHRRSSVERLFCKKFLLPWVIVKIVEMVLCHIIQLIFLSQGPSLLRQNDLLPIVVTYYLTLFIILVSLVVHISCFSYAGIQNPCYFMGVISSSILTLTTTLGILIMLTSMEYYRTFTEILVLVFVAILLCSLFMELCLCYIEVKSVWNKIGACQQHYVT